MRDGKGMALHFVAYANCLKAGSGDRGAIATLAAPCARARDHMDPKRAAACLFLLFSLSRADAAEVSGRISLAVEGRPLLTQEAVDTVVYFRPDRSARTAPAAEYVMRTRGKQFDPQVLVVPVGATVRFPNTDPILHNVFSATGRNAFDLGTYGRGEGRTRRFEQAGLVRVYCNVHHQMAGYILVLDTPYVARPDAQGSYRLGLPDDASGELFAWHPRGPLWRRKITRGSDIPDEIRIALDRPRVPPHANKYGRPYERHGARGY